MRIEAGVDGARDGLQRAGTNSVPLSQTIEERCRDDATDAPYIRSPHVLGENDDPAGPVVIGHRENVGFRIDGCR
jgi:hypothetical protein